MWDPPLPGNFFFFSQRGEIIVYIYSIISGKLRESESMLPWKILKFTTSETMHTRTLVKQVGYFQGEATQKGGIPGPPPSSEK